MGVNGLKKVELALEKQGISSEMLDLFGLLNELDSKSINALETGRMRM